MGPSLTRGVFQQENWLTMRSYSELSTGILGIEIGELVKGALSNVQRYVLLAGFNDCRDTSTCFDVLSGWEDDGFNVSQFTAKKTIASLEDGITLNKGALLDKNNYPAAMHNKSTQMKLTT
ncbi:unnamed protein product [Echinostoma caproni]|uniref:Uncharacterized protein n=1 Tax=Echinostoma caproni TaxID=27848 RepID=A0A183ADQ9_9TREM|nr:unnamed protein product [Echinostoma caproni]